jgi:hypothetical protein
MFSRKAFTYIPIPMCKIFLGIRQSTTPTVIYSVTNQ